MGRKTQKEIKQTKDGCLKVDRRRTLDGQQLGHIENRKGAIYKC